MQKPVGVLVPHQHQLRGEFFIALPELQQHGEKRRHRNAAGDVCTGHGGFFRTAQRFAGRSQRFGATVKKRGIGFGKSAGVLYAGHNKAANSAPLVTQLRRMAALMVAQQVVNGHNGVIGTAFCPLPAGEAVNLPVCPADPAGRVQIGQIDPAVISPELILADQKILIVFQKNPAAQIHLQVVVPLLVHA